MESLLEITETVEVKDEKTFLDVIAWSKAQAIQLSLNQLPLRNGRILYSDLEIVFLDAGQKIFFFFKVNTKSAVYYVEKGTGSIVIDSKSTSQNLSNDQIGASFRSWYCLMHYLLRYRNEPTEVEKVSESVRREIKGKRSGKKKRYTVYLSKTRYTIKRVPCKKPVQWTTESWEVRGHFRKLRSGKEIFIQPYTKGLGKKKKSSKVYKI